MKLLLCVLAIFVAASKGESNQTGVCPDTWTVPVNTSNKNGVCECGSDINGIVQCFNQTRQVYVRQCFCMTESSEDETVLVVGGCIYNCWRRSDFKLGHKYYLIPQDKRNVTQVTCGDWNREGQLCGSCKDGYAPPILSYNLKCMKCDSDKYGKGWTLLMVTGLLPITAFYILALLFRISANSAKLNGFILFAQIASSAPLIRVAVGAQQLLINHSMSRVLDTLFTLYGIWNLNFLRTILPQFCIPDFDTLAVLSVQTAIALYPLLLTTLTYIMVEMHARNVKLVVMLWTPFHSCTVSFRKQLEIKRSIIDVFATFFLLSYTKLLFAAFDLYSVTTIYNISGSKAEYTYYLQGTWTLQTIWKTIVIQGSISCFLIFPVALMLLYPMKCFHKCLQKTCCCKGRSYLALKTFMDCFQGCFKDGTNGTRNCQYVAGFYFLIRIIVWLLYAFATHTSTFYPLATGLFVTSAIVIALIRPYKPKYSTNNIVDPLALLLLGLLFASIDFLNTGRQVRTQWTTVVPTLAIAVIAILPLIYITVITLMKVSNTAVVKRVTKAFRHRIIKKNNEEIQPIINPDTID